MRDTYGAVGQGPGASSAPLWRRRAIAILLIGSLLDPVGSVYCGTPAIAREDECKAREAVGEGTLDPESYVLGAGDQLLVTVLGKARFSYLAAVAPDGNLLVNLPSLLPEETEEVPLSPSVEPQLPSPLIQPVLQVQVSGLTMREAESALAAEFATFFRDVRVQLALVRERLSVSYVYVTGAVVAPGAYKYYAGMTVGDYLGVAGGATVRAHMRKMKIVKPNGIEIEADTGTIVERGDRIVLPEVGLLWWRDYVTIASAVTALILSWMAIAK